MPLSLFSRRKFCKIILTPVVLPFWGCAKQDQPRPAPNWVQIAPRASLKPGWNLFPVERVALFVEEGGEVRAQSLICSHQACLLNQIPSGGFSCPCHGSNFTEQGEVINGPATEDLAHFEVKLDDQGKVLVALRS